MTYEAIIFKGKKVKLWRKYVRTRNKYDTDNYVKCKNRIRSPTRNLRSEFERNLVDNIKNNQIQVYHKEYDSIIGKRYLIGENFVGEIPRRKFSPAKIFPDETFAPTNIFPQRICYPVNKKIMSTLFCEIFNTLGLETFASRKFREFWPNSRK